MENRNPIILKKKTVKMITKVSKPLLQILSAFRFSTFSKRNADIEISRNNGGQGGVMTQDAERIF